MAATPEVLAARGLSHGDEVFYTGLFTKHVPATRNIPIVRIGNIAALPEEPITWRRERAGGPELVTMDPPYLVETRSIAGLSGSPVFVNFSGVRTQGRSVSMVAGPQPFYLLGLMHGHWDIDPSREWAATVHEDSLREEMVNMGIGIVVPIDSVREVLDQPILKNPREVFAAAPIVADLPTSD